MPISSAELAEVLHKRYGRSVKPTSLELAHYEEMADSGTLLIQQERRDILRLARMAMATDDEGAARAALVRWNTLYPEDTYSNVAWLIGVEDDD